MQTNKATVVVLEPHDGLRELLVGLLEEEGYHAFGAKEAFDIDAHAEALEHDVAWMALHQLRGCSASVVVRVGPLGARHGPLLPISEAAVETTLSRPFELAELLGAVERSLHRMGSAPLVDGAPGTFHVT